jgi:ATP-dependent Clp protease ATP-binding subunit ClpA
MFERFTPEARAVLQDARTRARTANAPVLDEEHVLAALLDRPGPRGLVRKDTGSLLDEIRDAHRRAGLSDLDAAALADLGVDVEEIVRRAEEGLGAGALDGRGQARRRRWAGPRLSRALRRDLVVTLRQTRARRDQQIGAEHLLLGLVSGRGLVADVLASRGITTATVLAALDERVGRRAS